MNTSFKLIELNIFLIIVVLLLLLAIKLLFPTKKIPMLFYVLIFSFLPVASVLRPGTYESGDLSLHSVGTLSFYNAFIQGSPIPRWAGDLNNGYGSVYHTLMYFLPHYIPTLLHFTGIPILISLKIFIILSFILSGVGMYLWAKQEVGKTGAFVSSIFYLYAPYHLIDTHFRVSTGEILAFAVVPFCFYFLKKFNLKHSLTFAIFTSLTITTLVLSHQAIAFVCIPILFLYGILNGKLKIANVLSIIIIFLAGGLLSSFYVLPLLFEHQYTAYVFGKNLSYLNISDLLFSPYRYGLLFQGPKGELAMVLGYSQWLVAFAALGTLFLKNIPIPNKKIFTFFVVTFFILLFCILPYSKIIWKSVPILTGFESTYRLLLIESFIVAALAGFLVKALCDPKMKHTKNVFVLLLFKNRTILISLLLFLTIFQTILNWGNRRPIPEIAEDSYFEKYIPIFTIEGGGNDYAFPRWVNPKSQFFRTSRTRDIELVTGDATIKETKRLNTKHFYQITVTNPSVIRENTFYYPGWKIYANDISVPILYNDAKTPGVMEFRLPPGIFDVEVVFNNTPLRTIGDTLSLIVFTMVFLLFLFQKRVKYLKRLIKPSKA